MNAEQFDNDAPYQAWLNGNPRGYVVNSHRPPTATYLVLHRASCHTISGIPASGRSWTNQYIKVGASTKADAFEWCRTNVGDKPTPCGTCAP
jgi:hypothetical protein